VSEVGDDFLVNEFIQRTFIENQRMNNMLSTRDEAIKVLMEEIEWHMDTLKGERTDVVESSMGALTKARVILKEGV
jgi:hypothetical protein